MGLLKNAAAYIAAGALAISPAVGLADEIVYLKGKEGRTTNEIYGDVVSAGDLNGKSKNIKFKTKIPPEEFSKDDYNSWANNLGSKNLTEKYYTIDIPRTEISNISEFYKKDPQEAVKRAILPGGGNIYLGNKRLGIALFGATAASYLAGIYFMAQGGNNSTNGLFAFGIGLSLHAYDLVGSYKSAEEGLFLREIWPKDERQ